MGRHVKKREDYDGDAIVLKRIKKAIRHDIERPEDWRTEVTEALSNVIRLLLTAPPRDTSESEAEAS